MRSFVVRLCAVVSLIVVVPSVVYAQGGKNKVDSLKSVLLTEHDEKERGKLYWKIADATDENDPTHSIPYADSALMIARHIKDTSMMIDAYVAKGIAFDNLGEFAPALQCQTTALDLAQANNDELKAASCYTNIGMLYSRQDNLVKSKEYFRKSMLIREKFNHKLLASSYLNMSTAFFAENNFDSARYYAEKSIASISDTTDKKLLAYAYSALASTYFGEGDFKNSIAYYEKSKEIKESVNDRRGLISSYANIGESYANLKQYDLAIQNLNIALAIATSLKHKYFLREVYYTLADVYRQSGDYKSAYEMFQLHTQYRDSIFNDQKSSELLDLQEKYESTQKQRENELLKNTNDIQAESIRRKDLLNYSVIACLLLALAGGFYIFYAYRQKKRANLEISRQKAELEIRNKEVFDSITYAKRIQFTLLANDELLAHHIPDHFVYFKPKDIVSGDFYWASASNNGDFFLASCDSTGHGVPGAFMSLLNTSFLNEAVNEKDIHQPGEILDYVRERLVKSVSKEGAQDGMDATLLRFSDGRITYAAANNNPVIVRNGTLTELSADKMPVGMGSSNPFTTHSLGFTKGDVVYIFTDGYADQFGGPKGKKFKYKQLYDLLEKNAHRPMSEIHTLLSDAHEQWRGNLEQVDDICIIGFRC